MIAARALQGFLGGAMIPTVFSSAYLIFPRDRQVTMSAIVGLVATLAPTLGPTLGGWLTTTFSWHWLFLVNLVPGIVVTVGVLSFLDIDRPDWSLLEGFDWIGLVAMAAFLGSLEFVLDEGPDQDWLADGTVRALAFVMLAGAALFFWRVLTHYNPIVDLRCFRNRNFAIGSLFSFVLGIGLYGAVFLLPLFLGRVRHYTALDIGYVMAVTGIAQFITAPIAARLSTRSTCASCWRSASPSSPWASISTASSPARAASPTSPCRRRCAASPSCSASSRSTACRSPPCRRTSSRTRAASSTSPATWAVPWAWPSSTP